MEKIRLLTENGFEDRELMYPYCRVQEAGYQVVVVPDFCREALKVLGENVL